MKRVTCVVLGSVLMVFSGTSYSQLTLTDDTPAQIAGNKLSSMPLTFTENLGQWDERALFKAEAGGAVFWFCENEVVYVFTRDTDEMVEDDRLTRHTGSFPDESLSGKSQYKKESHIIKAQFVNATAIPEVIGEGRLPHNCNYFYGNDPARWRTDVPNYSEIVYRDIYPGIDLKYYGNSQSMKYDFVVHPGADLSRISIRYTNVDDMSISQHGDLQMTTKFGPVYENKPYVYQDLDGRVTEVAAGYYLKEPGILVSVLRDMIPTTCLSSIRSLFTALTWAEAMRTIPGISPSMKPARLMLPEGQYHQIFQRTHTIPNLTVFLMPS